MMRRTLVAALLVFCTAGVAPRAADAQFLRFGLAAGPSSPVGDLGDIANTGFNVQGLASLRPPLLPLGFRGELLFQRLPLTDDGSFRQLAGVANGVFTLLPTPIVSPYLIGGVGIYNSSVTDGDSSSDVGVNVGAGLRVNLLVLEGFAEARYHHVGNDARTIPISIGVLF